MSELNKLGLAEARDKLRAGEVTSGRRTGLEGSSFWMLGGEVLAVWVEVVLWLWCGGGGAQYSK